MQTSIRPMPLHGFDDEDRANNALGWFASSVARRALKIEPAANSVLFAVGRVVRDNVTRVEYAFVLSEESEPGWPVISSPKVNAMLGDGRSQTVISRAIRELYGCDQLDMGHLEGEPFYTAFARYTRDPRPADSPFASAFAPVALFTRRVYEKDSWEARRSDFGLAPKALATVLSPECISPAKKPLSDDPRDLYDPITVIETIRSAQSLEYTLRRATDVQTALDAYCRAPSNATLRALRALLGVRETEDAP
ncbi:MAG: hypothetical protein U0269_32965 [Polyangiales bacterium]